MLRLPIGYDNFGQIRTEGLTLVDKTLFIKDFWDDTPQVSLITRPRRFGKSLNLSMLHHFFSASVAGRSTQGLFDNLKIAEAGDAYMRHQGQYPVIAISFKDIKESSFDKACANLAGVISHLFTEHREILANPKIPDEKKIEFERVLYQKASLTTLENALSDLSYCLFEHYGKNPIILIDEYDTPIQSGYMYHYYDEMINFMRNLFGKALKSNPYLHRAVLTGILRVSKESLFSGLNNLEVYSMFNAQYSEYFGFTEAEVTDLFHRSQLDIALKDVRDWYNGYQMGNTVIYNPWSIVNCLKQKGALRPYWVNTSGHDVLKQAIAKSDVAFKMNMESLLAGIPVQRLVDENFVFGDLDNNESALWSLLLASGYLKAIKAVPEEDLMNCTLLFPNNEVAIVYRSMFNEWFRNKMGQGNYQQFLDDFLLGNVEDFTYRLKEFLLESASFFDVKGTHPEKFYHGFVLGLIASLQERYTIKSNRESGHGRYDLMIIPKDKQKLGIVLEFKTAKAEEDLAAVALQALQQVKDKQYEAELKQAGIQSILKLGLAFKGKDVAVVSE
jgi:Predicted AAA-ATPase/PD-(D/E)XK nuclease superfamily